MRHSPLLLAQFALFVVFIGTTALLPPAHGPILLIPLRQGPVATINLALAHGGSLLAFGPVRGSVIVEGDRDRLASAMFADGTLMVAASPAICGVLPQSRELS